LSYGLREQKSDKKRPLPLLKFLKGTKVQNFRGSTHIRRFKTGALKKYR